MVSGILEDLASIRNYYTEQDRKREEREAGRSTWLKLKDKESANILFLQELAKDAPGYREDRGLGFIAMEHVHPDDFRKKALCTAADGACFGCELNKKGWDSNQGKDKDDETRYKGAWKARHRLYINVLVMKAGEEPFVAILSQGKSEKMITDDLLDYAVDDGTIRGQVFKLTRRGDKFNNTSYSIKGLPNEEVPDDADYEVFDLHKVVRSVPYEEQPAFFGVETAEDTSGPAESGADDDDDLNW